VAEVEDAPPEPEAAGPERPDLRFFGTVRQGGKMAALVTARPASSGCGWATPSGTGRSPR
jgi:hypothetical protein